MTTPPGRGPGGRHRGALLIAMSRTLAYSAAKCSGPDVISLVIPSLNYGSRTRALIQQASSGRHSVPSCLLDPHQQVRVLLRWSRKGHALVTGTSPLVLLGHHCILPVRGGRGAAEVVRQGLAGHGAGRAGAGRGLGLGLLGALRCAFGALTAQTGSGDKLPTQHKVRIASPSHCST